MLSAKELPTTSTMPRPMLNTWSISACSTPPSRCSQVNTGGTGQRPTLDHDLHARRNHAGQVLVQPAAGDVGDGMHRVLHAIVRQDLPDGPDVDPRGREQGLADRRAKLLDVVRDLVPADVEGDLAGQAVAVGVQAGGGEPQHDVAGRHRRAVDDLAPRGHAHAEARQVVVASGVQVGEDGRLAAQQCAIGLNAAVAHALHQVLQQSGVVLGHGHVVEEEQRFGPAAQGVVDAHGHQVDAHRLVITHRAGHLELGAHPVGTGDQYRVFILAGEEAVGEVEAEEAREAIRPRG